MISDQTLEVLIRKKLSFPRTRVYEAWIKKEHMMAWMGPNPGISVSKADWTVEVGAEYSLGFLEPDGKINTVKGSFLVVTPPEKLVFTWTWELPLPDAGVDTLVTVEFFETDGGTEIVLKHQKFTGQEMCDRHLAGWQGALSRYENFFIENNQGR